MSQYDATTGHTTSPHAHAGEDDYAEARYNVTVVNYVSGQGVYVNSTVAVIAADANTAERKVKAQWYRTHGHYPKSVSADYAGARQ